METLIKAITLATSKVGIREETGKNDGPFIDECLALCKLDNPTYIKNTGKGYAWCAAFICWVLFHAGAKITPTSWAPSLFPANKLVTNKKYRIMDVVGINYGGYENGHVRFFFAPIDETTFLSLEGNWGNRVGINVCKYSDINAVSRWI